MDEFQDTKLPNRFPRHITLCTALVDMATHSKRLPTYLSLSITTAFMVACGSLPASGGSDINIPVDPNVRSTEVMQSIEATAQHLATPTNKQEVLQQIDNELLEASFAMQVGYANQVQSLSSSTLLGVNRDLNRALFLTPAHSVNEYLINSLTLSQGQRLDNPNPTPLMTSGPHLGTSGSR